MLRTLLSTFALLSLLPLCACGSAKGPVKMTEAATSAGAWERVVAEHTRQRRVFNLEDVSYMQMDLRATLVTPRLRSAFAQARPRLHGAVAEKFDDVLIEMGAPPDEGMDAERVLTRPLDEERVLVVVSVYVAHEDGANFDHARYSIWDLNLERGDAKVAPEDIERIRYSAALQGLLPHADRYDETYLLRFPLVDTSSGTPLLSPGGEPLRFTVKSGVASATLEWQLLGGPEDVASTSSTESSTTEDVAPDPETVAEEAPDADPNDAPPAESDPRD